MRPCPGSYAYGVMPESRSELKLILPSGSPLTPAGPDRLVGSGPDPLMFASGKRMFAPSCEKKSDIAGGASRLLYTQAFEKQDTRDI